MRVVIDTNVVVSAVLRDRNPEAVILFVIGNPDFEWVASREIVEEYIGVLSRERFAVPKEILNKWSDIFNEVITLLDVTSTVNFPRDQKDARFVTCALSAGADYLITGDKDFEEAYKLMSTTVISVSYFKRLVSDHW
ncbi:MAG: putative toxin-antitoxin system toxin component, PIN family [Deltaproteobacteria bacterium]|nr:putative toxin-antitoxin system toxin component, PIN family [Deltaproteobacteria bacterium]